MWQSLPQQTILYQWWRQFKFLQHWLSKAFRSRSHRLTVLGRPSVSLVPEVTVSFTLAETTPPTGWPAHAVHVTNTSELVTAVDQNSSGTVFALEAGAYSGQLPVKSLNQYLGDPDPAKKTIFTGSGWDVVGGHFVKATVNDVVLKHLTVRHYGPENNSQNGSVIQGGIQTALGTGWLLEDMDIGYSRENAVRWTNGWKILKSHLHHMGRYGVSGGGAHAEKLMEDTEVSYCGVTHDGIPHVASSNRGFSKFAVSRNITLRQLHVHHCYHGPWWDIANVNGKVFDLVVHDIDRIAIDLEISYGPFLIDGVRGWNIGTNPTSDELTHNWGLPPAIIVTLTPDVVVRNVDIDGADQGLIVNQWNHPVLTNPGPYVDISKLGCENILFEAGDKGSRITNVTNFTPERATNGTNSYSAGLRGGQQSGIRPTRNIHWDDAIVFDADAKYKSALHI